MRARTFLPALLLVSLTACEEAFGPGSALPGESSFVFGYAPFAGRPAGTYAAVGEARIQSGGGLPFGDWAFAYRSGPSPQPVLVDASRAAGNGRFDVVSLVLPNGAHGGQTLALGQECTDAAGCASMSVDFGFLPQTLERELDCAIRSGTLHLQTLTNDRVTGSFSGMMVCDGLEAQTPVQSGLFDVAMWEPTPR